MFIGETRAGKSHAARDLLDAEGLPVVVVNDHTKDPLRPGYRRISWSEVLEVVHCNVLVEDLINVTPKEVAVLQQILNYNHHHHVLPTVIFIAHSSTKTGAFTTLKQMTHFCFMCKRSTVSSIVDVLDLFKFSKADSKAKVDAFLDDLGKTERTFWVLEVESGKFERQPGSLARSISRPAAPAPIAAAPDATPAQKREQALLAYRKTAETYLNLFSLEAKKALAIFDFIMAKTPLQALNPADLNFTLRDKKSGHVVNVSLLDYLHTLTTQTKPSRGVLDLHAYLAKHVALPRCFITNDHPKFAPPT